MHELASLSERRSSELTSSSDGSKPSEVRRRSTGDDDGKLPHQRLELHVSPDLEFLLPQSSFFCLTSLSDRRGERDLAPRLLH